MIYQIGAMIVGLLLVSGAALWGLNALDQDFGTALEGYGDLRMVFEVASHVTTARALLATSQENESRAADELQTAADRFRAFLVEEQREGNLRRPTHIGNLEKQVYGSLTMALARLRIWLQLRPLEVPSAVQVASLEPVYRDLNNLAGAINKEIAHSQRAAQDKRRTTIAAVGMVSAAIVLGAIILGWIQYHSVTSPLNRLGRAVRRFATGKFDPRIRPEGYAEFIALAHDLNRMAGQLQELYQQLEQKVAVKSRELVQSERLASVGFLAAGVAHEINNPLSIITGYAEMSLKQLEADPSAQSAADAVKTLRVVCEEAFRCKQITEKLLSLSRSKDETRKPVSLVEVARDVASMVGGLPAYRERKLSLTTSPADQLGQWTVLASEAEMKQVMLNLTINALEAAPPQGGRVSIDVSRNNGWVELVVVDNGRGMSHDTMERVFEPFFTAKRGTGEPGTGLGLSISHAIVTNHGGRMAAHSEGVGKGSRFTVQLPAVGEDHGTDASD
jgi:signal transduction histidine kinase